MKKDFEKLEEQELSYGKWLQVSLYLRYWRNRRRESQVQEHATRIFSMPPQAKVDVILRRRKNRGTRSPINKTG